MGTIALFAIVSPYFGAPPQAPLIGLMIGVGIVLLMVVTHEGFQYHSTKLKLSMLSMVVTSGISAILVLAIAQNLITDPVDYFTIGPVGIGRSSIWLAISGAAAVLNFVILKFAARSEGFE